MDFIFSETDFCQANRQSQQRSCGDRIVIHHARRRNHRALCPHTTFDFYIPPRLDDLKNDGGLFYIDGGGDPLVKHWTSLYLSLELSETNSGPTFRIKDPA